MSGIGSGYDLSCSSYSPDGRIFQIEYAAKAVDNSGTAVAVKCKDGVVLAVEKLVFSKMLEKGSNRRVFGIDSHIGMTFGGLGADARALANRGRKEAKDYKSFYSTPIPPKTLVERLSGYVQTHTLYGHVRPFGVSALVIGYDENGPQLYMIEPSGVSYGYRGTAAGKARQLAKSEIEKLKLEEMNAEQAAFELARIIHTVHDDKQKFELEMSWICKDSGYQHRSVPEDVLEKIEKQAIAAVNDDMDDDEI